MKTSISIPYPLFRKAERLAKRLGISRSRFYTQAVECYFKTHLKTQQAKGVTEALNAVNGTESSELDPDLEAAACHFLSKEKW